MGGQVNIYVLTIWVTQIKWESTIGSATSYRVKRLGFTIDKVVCGEWLTKNNEEVLVPNPEPYFDVFVVDHVQYIRYGNLGDITKVKNKNFHELQPMNGTDAELPKYKYNYGAPIHLFNMLPNSGEITADNLPTDVKMVELHDWGELPNVKQGTW